MMSFTKNSGLLDALRLSSRKHRYNVTKPFVICILLASVATRNIADAWKHCSPEEGGGICPVGNSCCPTGTPGISSCVPGREKDPEGAKGQCCDPEGTTGCAYGYDCALKGGTDRDNWKGKQQEKLICKRREPHPEYLNAEETPRYELCRLPPSSSSDTYDLQKFPIDGYNAVYYSSMGSILPTDEKHSVAEMHKFSSVETVVVIVHGSGRNADDYLCAGISTAAVISNSNKSKNENEDINGNRTSIDPESSSTNDIETGKVLVIAPKFLADIDYDDRSRYQNTLYWLEHGRNVPLGHTWRYGADAVNNYSVPVEDSSRSDNRNHNSSRAFLEDDENGNIYGGGKYGISSYAVMDRLLEFLIGSKHQKNERRSLRQSLQQKEEYYFPKLNRVVVAGHSAGGQYVHRWSLLSSSSMVWGDVDSCVHKEDRVDTNETIATKTRKIEMRMVVANPRSYCYPDNRRMIRTEKGVTREPRHLDSDAIGMKLYSNNHKVAHLNIDEKVGIDDGQYIYNFAVPDPRDVDTCPTYDQWQWGLESGGDILCPYKDTALDLLNNNLTVLALRYSKRKLFYLAGEYDTIVQEDRCETYNFQGDHRNERARRYFRALTEYLTTLRRIRTHASKNPDYFIHEFHPVPGSPHDHTIMFQSTPSRKAFYGTEQESIMYDIFGDYDDERLRTESI